MDTPHDTSPAAPAATRKALRITTDERLELIEVPTSDALLTLQRAVGGFIEILDIAPDLSMVLDEEGKLKGKPRNDIAIRLIHHFAVPLQPGDLIVGDVVLMGIDASVDMDDGDSEADVPDSAIELLARLGYPVS
ncbi:protein of unknown function [Plantibacter flavus]|uniref:Uncharacterized protein DUF3846 n=1 Tax=Plantibacter flavus TaxID=150123 RepID=A0A3N2BLJ6_9MICO|nr:DUF3846 domain-containing protein [Plantibacter flavus]ROR76078.1 uncharacterized protein DUF3846 [Plantibacter flavus]SMG48867.1 protein of unknown function [Plantibacter flavus]